MRAVVALVEARPETIIEDYQRVMDLAGLDESVGRNASALIPQARPGGWLPAAGSPPWQLDGVLSWLEKRPGSPSTAGDAIKPAVVFPVSPTGGSAPAQGWAWDDVLARHGAETASGHFRSSRNFRAEPALPNLEQALSGGLQIAAGLRDRTTILLPVPALVGHGQVQGALALLRGLLVGDLGQGFVSDEAVQSEIMGLARQALPGLGVVMDAVLWQVGKKPGVRPALARNILLAGRDPVAVDAVAMRLAGGDPDRDPLMRLFRDQDLGAVREVDIRLAGRADLMELDFGVPDSIIPRPAWVWDKLPLPEIFRNGIRRSSLIKRHARTPWGRLFDDYRAGGPTGERA